MTNRPTRYGIKNFAKIFATSDQPKPERTIRFRFRENPESFIQKTLASLVERLFLILTNPFKRLKTLTKKVVRKKRHVDFTHCLLYLDGARMKRVTPTSAEQKGSR